MSLTSEIMLYTLRLPTSARTFPGLQTIPIPDSSALYTCIGLDSKFKFSKKLFVGTQSIAAVEDYEDDAPTSRHIFKYVMLSCSFRYDIHHPHNIFTIQAITMSAMLTIYFAAFPL